MKRTLGALALVLLTAGGAIANITVTRRSGGWTDVTVSRGALTVVRADGSMVIAERLNGERRWAVTLPEDSLYLRAVADPDDTVVAVVQGHDTGNAYALSAQGARVLGPSFGQNAVAVGWTPGAGFMYLWFTSARTYDVENGSGCLPCTVTTLETSQGFRDVTLTGVVVLGDNAFTRVFNGRQLWEYQTRGGVTVGQCDPPAICAAADGRTFAVIPGESFEPHVVTTDDGFAVAARTADGAALALVTPPYPGAPVVDRVPGPVVNVAAMPNHRLDLVALRSQYPAMLNQAQAGELMGRLAFQLRNEGFGLLRKDAGNNCPVNGLSVRVSCDWILHQPSQTGCDVLGDAPASDGPGAASPGWCAGDPADFSRFVTVTSDPGFVGGGVPPVINPPSPVPAGVTRAELDAAIAGVRAETSFAVSGLRQTLGEVEARLNGRIDGIHTIDLPALQNAIETALAGYEVNGKTSRDSLGLQHQVKLGITKRK